MKVSAIIPVLNEQACVGNSVQNLFRYGGGQLQEVIVVDGGSTDNTCEVARASGATVVVA